MNLFSFHKELFFQLEINHVIQQPTTRGNVDMGAEDRKCFQISHRKLKNSISHDVVIMAPEPDAVLKKYSKHNITSESKIEVVIHYCDLSRFF